ncbi:hypothetical protein [Flavilitoribacter nigricans]|uniref:Lipocalin-like domain-containing protein n=1 Tax=Flavilitoribacter nigricans (strain ATCC 23147 / DSM 23189 / NBRC 102662 / NCIMB 1420 / SS-2) TaxID=1122177 RepID=A0A2D0N013_FLAN2|nr:hypothetical protein [Flavilitoribacter nigricans]PHN01043.1 hypothetical protein CRP01_39260 [Flavilitoribacter nigricans DSM 23189 = NBRC 102662]
MLSKHPILFFLILFSLAGCQSEQYFDDTAIQGLWQSLNDREYAVAFREDGSFGNYTRDKDLFADLYEWNAIHYKVNKVIDAKRVELILFDNITKKEFMRAEVHRVDENRIRILFIKHHNILDLADEFHKTDGFGNFEEIMDSIY